MSRVLYITVVLPLLLFFPGLNMCMLSAQLPPQGGTGGGGGHRLGADMDGVRPHQDAIEKHNTINKAPAKAG